MPTSRSVQPPMHLTSQHRGRASLLQRPASGCAQAAEDDPGRPAWRVVAHLGCRGPTGAGRGGRGARGGRRLGCRLWCALGTGSPACRRWRLLWHECYSSLRARPLGLGEREGQWESSLIVKRARPRQGSADRRRQTRARAGASLCCSLAGSARARRPDGCQNSARAAATGYISKPIIHTSQRPAKKIGEEAGARHA